MRSILVIDPNAELRNFVSGILSRAGHHVRQTDDIRLAAPLLRAERTDLIVTDLALPNRGGVETIEALRQEFPGMEVIAISSAPHATGYLRLAAALGARRTVAEPFMSRELMGLINEMVAGVAAYTAHRDYQARRNASTSN